MNALVFFLVSTPEHNVTPKEVDKVISRVTSHSVSYGWSFGATRELMQRCPISTITDEVLYHNRRWIDQGFHNPSVELRALIVRDVEGVDLNHMTANAKTIADTILSKVVNNIRDSHCSNAIATRVPALFMLTGESEEEKSLISSLPCVYTVKRN